MSLCGSENNYMPQKSHGRNIRHGKELEKVLYFPWSHRPFKTYFNMKCNKITSFPHQKLLLISQLSLKILVTVKRQIPSVTNLENYSHLTLKYFQQIYDINLKRLLNTDSHIYLVLKYTKKRINFSTSVFHTRHDLIPITAFQNLQKISYRIFTKYRNFLLKT